MEFKLSRIKNISLMFIAVLVLAACGGAPSGGADSQLVSEIEITLGATSIEADGVSSVAVRAEVKDQDDKAVSGATVTFSSSLGSLSSSTATTDVNGIAQVALIAGSTAGAANVTVSASGFNASETITFASIGGVVVPVDGDQLVSSIAVTTGSSTIIANGSDTVAVRAVVEDQDGVVISGAGVTFGATLGSLAATTAVTNENGIAQVILTAGSVTGASAVTASSGGYNAIGSISFLSEDGAIGTTQLVSSISVTLGASSIVANDTDTVALRAVVGDQDGNAISGATVAFDSDLGSLSALTAATDENGIAQVTLTAGSVAGASAVRATSAGFNASGTVTFLSVGGTVGDDQVVSSISITLGASSLTANGSDTLAVRAIVEDQDGQAISGETVTFGSSLGSLSSATFVTDENGFAQVTLTAGTVAGASGITATAAGFNASGTVTFLSTATPVLIVDDVILTLGASSIIANGSDEIVVRATVTDQNNDPLAGVDVSFSSSLGVLSDATITTDLNGIAQVTLTAGTVSGVSDVRVSASGFNEDANVTFTPAVVALVVDDIALTLGSNTIVAGGANVAVRATVRDQNGDLLNGAAVTFTATSGSLDSVSATTNENGIAEVSLTSGTLTGASLVTVTASGFSDSGSITIISGSAASVVLRFSPASVVTSGISAVTATVVDVNGNAVVGETVTFSFDSEGSGIPVLSAVTALTNANGLATSSYTAGSSGGTDTVSARTSNNTNDSDSIVASAESVIVGSVLLTLGADSVVADGATGIAVRAEVLDVDSNPVVGEIVSFSSSVGSLSAATDATDSDGLAQVTLTPGTSPALALVNVSISGFSDSVNLPFVAGPPSTGSSVISGSPSSVPADGSSTSEVTVLLVDANSNLVADGTSVTLQASAGSITTATTATTSSGRASFTLQASSVSETATLSITQYPGITGSVEFGATGTGTATSVATTIAQNFLSIAGVGGVDNTSITISVTDDSGVLISDPGNDNIRISFLTNPGGGEFISVGGGSSTTTIDARTEDGSVTFNLQAGNLPGAVELQILVDSTGVFGSPEVTSLIPQISVASGPPETIVLSTPITNSIENIGEGAYRRSATLIVTDRFGNAVPDGTAINLGIIDSVIVDSDSGQLTGTSLTDTAPTFSDGAAIAAFSSASIVRNSSNRLVEQGDRVLVTDVIDAVDKSRFVSSAINLTDVGVQSAFVGAETSLDYVIGAALLGVEISGLDSDGVLTSGSVLTENGLASVRVTYPANINTIRIGCFEVQDDLRYSPNDSARVFMVASATSGSATLVDEGTLCFAPISDFTLVAEVETVTSTTNVNLTLRDGGDTIPLPFYGVSCDVVVETDGVGTFDVTATNGFTDINGDFATTITVTNGVANDAATVTCRDVAGEDTVDISVDIP